MTRTFPWLLVVGAGLGLLWACPARVEQLPPPVSTSDGGDVDGGTGDDAGWQEADSGSPSGLDVRPANPSCVVGPRPQQNTSVAVVPAFTRLSFTQPVLLLHAPGETQRLFVVERRGIVRVFDRAADAGTSQPFVDIAARVNSAAGQEAGLLGVAFHPDWAQNREVFLSYTGFGGSTNLRTVIARYKSNDNGLTLDPATESIVLTVDQPYSNHNGGGIHFGPDGFLYIGLGDGGSGGDPQRNGQNTRSLLGKFLRIDVDSAQPYAIPADNPFRADGGRPEIFAWGLRNPWRWSFDRGTGELWAGDVGQNAWEEVDKVVRGGNYGWNTREGAHCYGASSCDAGGLIDPVVEYGRGEGVSITGGHVYRGSAIPSLVGRFVYGDFGSGRIWAVGSNPSTGAPVAELLLDTNLQLSSFGEGPDGELYLLDFGTGRVHQLVPNAAPPPPSFPEKLSATGCFQPQDVTRWGSGVIPYDVNAPLWSDGAAKERAFALPDGARIRVNADGDLELPVGSVVLKTFLLGGRRVETRLLVRHTDGSWAGYSYEWNDAQTDGDLLASSKVKVVGSQSWSFPSRADCIVCHTAAAGRTLSLETAQLDRDFRYAQTSRTRNQLTTYQAIGLFEAPPPSGLPVLPTYDGVSPLAERARGYLHANCSGCHRPGGNGQGAMDFRFTTPLSSAQLCGVAPTAGNLGNPAARLVVPGRPTDSLISVRMHRLDAYRMPPLGTRVVDATGTGLVDGWISSLGTCP